ncbi:MAG: hypothetical protein EOO09_04985 [Chitinophagaceae bacterium]|nr:MAG: hypothetical protein EOO09_04985 [Chitinophagaceae bacterium]
MKRTFLTAITFICLLLTACNNDPANAGKNNTAQTASASTGDFYFDFSVDGKEFHIPADDVLTSYRPDSKGNVMKIFAGKDGETSLVLTIPGDLSKPSSTPSGSPDFALDITQGSVSLQNFPEKNYTTNSFNTTYPEMAVQVPDAVVITSSEAVGDKGRILTGTIKVKTFAEHGSTDSKDKDRNVTGRFRVMHEFKGEKF